MLSAAVRPEFPTNQFLDKFRVADQPPGSRMNTVEFK